MYGDTKIKFSKVFLLCAAGCRFVCFLLQRVMLYFLVIPQHSRLQSTDVMVEFYHLVFSINRNKVKRKNNIYSSKVCFVMARTQKKFYLLIINHSTHLLEHAVAQSVEKLCRKVAGSIPHAVIRMFH